MHRIRVISMKGSLKCPRGAGCPDGHIGTNGEHLYDDNKLACYRHTGLPHTAFKRSFHRLSFFSYPVYPVNPV